MGLLRSGSSGVFTRTSDPPSGVAGALVKLYRAVTIFSKGIRD